MKLTDDKIRWIIRRKADGGMTTAQIAELQGVDQSRIRQLWLEFRNTGKVPTLKEPGRPKRTLSSWEEDKILELFASYPSNAVAMEKMLKQQGINISHDLIHRTLKDHGLAMSESNKRGRRKWVKYERKHTNSLWHTDYYTMEDPRWRGRWNCRFQSFLVELRGKRSAGRGRFART